MIESIGPIGKSVIKNHEYTIHSFTVGCNKCKKEFGGSDIRYWAMNINDYDLCSLCHYDAKEFTDRHYLRIEETHWPFPYNMKVYTWAKQCG